MHNYVLETERLLLHAPTLEDAPAIQVLVSDYDIAKTTLNIPYPYPEDGALDWISGLPRSEGHHPFVIVLRAEDALIGTININVHPHFKRAEVGYWIGKTYWNQGCATEATRRIIRFGFEEFDLVRIQAGYFSENIASRRVMEKAGMHYEATLRKYVQKWDEDIDLGMCAILREDYLGGT